MANVMVKVIFPLKLELKGKNGTIPIKLFIHIKKNKACIYGTFPYQCWVLPPRL